MNRAEGFFVDPMQRAIRRNDRELQSYSSVCLLDAVQRPDNGGREGKPIAIVSNLFSTRFNPDLQITQLDIRFVKTKELGPDAEAVVGDFIEKRPIMLTMFKLALASVNELTKEQRNAIVYDGAKNAFTCTNFPFPPGQSFLEVDVPRFNGLKRDERLTMIIKRTTQFDINVIKDFLSAKPHFVQTAQKSTSESVGRFLQVFNIAFRMDALDRCISLKNEKFFEPSRAKDITQGGEVWCGFFQSVLPLRGGLFVNLDLAFSPFMTKGPFLEVAAKILDNSPKHHNNRAPMHPGRGGGYGHGFNAHQRNGGNGGDAIPRFNIQDLQKLRKALRNVKIGLSHRPQARAKSFRGFTGASAQAEKFMMNGKELSVAEYYLKKYNMSLRFPHLPCAILNKDSKFNTEKKEWVPLELCVILENAPIPPHKLSVQQVQRMLQVTRQTPEHRLKDTIKWRKEREYEKNETLQTWGIEVSPEPVQLQARKLSPPQVAYRDGNVDRLVNGTWNLRSTRFLRGGVELITPVILNFTKEDPRQCEHFTLKLFNKCRQYGMEISARNIRCMNIDTDQADLKANIQNAAKWAYEEGGKKCIPQLIICFMDYSSELYQNIKRISVFELFTSVPTQCLDVRKALYNERGEAQYMSNIAMKINDKLSGFNHFLPNPKDLPMIGQNTMMIGIDVRHPPSRLQHDSVVAAVATLNGQGTRLGSQISTQFNPNLGHQQETVLDGKGMFIGLLNSWKKFNGGHLPESIIVFRDGVSQSEYTQVKEFEVTQLKQACTDTNTANDDQPKITYVVATKKHHLRMFALDERDLCREDGSGNLPAGTVTDQVVTHPYIFEFYLQAHTGIGCCRPCKYTVLHDDVKFTSDSIQRVVNSICYSHQRATRSVSRPPLVMYAHLLAYKSMFLLYPDLASDSSSIGGSVRNMHLVGYSIDDLRKRLNKRNIIPDTPAYANVVDSFSEVPWFL
ncbi:Piwi-domain-containing protein [Meira miltonrushii]|uniref:Piwi-domain-containing protein n=1 Tax=Meira miltonrushii TaxID=1280837 RepID=A0A316VFH0_9BASI|nr:Piwi-domain-containing protein [Meira miltonrushii]PWN36377.1 Piwi-domain-containing protein [Meira miltonrushii]